MYATNHLALDGELLVTQDKQDLIFPQIRWAGDSALVMAYEQVVDVAVNTQVIRCAEAIRSEQHAGVRDVVPSYCAVTVFFDPLRTNLEALSSSLSRHGKAQMESSFTPSTPLMVPVCYGGDYGPDLHEVARFGGCSLEEVVRRHTDTVYRVYALGFVPGFAYMGRVDQRIAMPRRDTPRTSVPFGSVGIAGVQTGVYPASTPGGWRLIGRTTLKPFDPERNDPFAFKPGDQVQFVSVTADELNASRD